MGKYVTGIIATGIGLALLVFSPKITNRLYNWYMSTGGITIPYLSSATTDMIMKALFGIILIFISLEIIVNGWKG